jgi:hypothetical protein
MEMACLLNLLSFDSAVVDFVNVQCNVIFIEMTVFSGISFAEDFAGNLEIANFKVKIYDVSEKGYVERGC